MKNEDLKSKYDNIYANDAYGKYFTFSAFPQSKLILEMIPAWDGLNVLDIGCGEGRFAAMLSFAGVNKVDGVDFSSESIKIAQNSFSIQNVSFSCKDYREINEKYDVVTLVGVLEHFDSPFEELDFIISNHLHEKGIVVTSSPSFINPRGYIWMSLYHLFDLRMSLSDLHFLCPFDFEEFCQEHGFGLEVKSTDQDWGAGERTILDFRKRLKNALIDAGYDSTKVDNLLEWLRKAVKYHQTDDFSGATCVYKIQKTP